jgi:lysine 6-dehydrogenase
MRVLVLGSGMMGSALAYDLANSPGVEEILIADIDEALARSIASRLGSRARGARLDVNYYDDVVAAMTGVDVTIGAVSYIHNYNLSRAAIETGTHFLDLGGNNDVVDRQMNLHNRAAESGVLIVPNCGLAPGMANVLVAGGAKRFESLDTILIRVGGLPQHPQPPLNYQLVFSPDGLINEYVEPAEVIQNGRIMMVESMTDLEEIVFPEPLGALEAFNTSGGLSTLARLLEGKVKEMNYKTIRYKGHCEKFKILLDVGFASKEPIMVGDTVRTARDVFTDLLRKKLPANGPDVTLLRATITGSIGGIRKTLAYEMIDYYDDANRMTSMMRTTAFPTSVMAQMIGRGDVTARGVLPPERCIPAGPMIEELKKRNIIIRMTEQ